MMKTLSKLFLLLLLSISYNAYSYDSGHEAGYEWAQENGILDPDECDSNSDSFNEGCEEGVEDNQLDYEENNGYEYYEEDYGSRY